MALKQAGKKKKTKQRKTMWLTRNQRNKEPSRYGLTVFNKQPGVEKKREGRRSEEGMAGEHFERSER
jgi:hypothetical protein